MSTTDIGASVKPALQKLSTGATLTEVEIATLIDEMTKGQATPHQMGAFLMALRVRGETVAEVTGAARYLRSKMLRVDAPSGAIDIVGTGGDGHNTYNVSTCAAIVAAAAGLKVAKHGNRSVSSLSGASDVLTALGVKIDGGAEASKRAIESAGVGFLWAPMHHAAMKAWAETRAALGVRTLFNVLGPISNPASVTRQVVGVFARHWVEPLAEALRNLGSEHAWVVHGHDGLDELSTTGPTTVAELKDGDIYVFDVTPEEAGLPRSTLADLKGGDAAANARSLRAVLDGAKGPYRDIVVMNTGAALVVGGAVASLQDGVAEAQRAIDSGRAKDVLDRLIAVTNA